MTAAEGAAYVAIAIGVVNLLTMLVGGGRKLGHFEQSFKQTLTERLIEQKEQFTAALTAHRREIDEESDRIRRDFGETVLALRQKLTDVEIFCRDTFVRRESFYEVTKGLADSVKAIGDKLEMRIEKLDGKLDRITARNDRRDRDGGGGV